MLNKNVKQIITYENFGIYLENKNVYYWDFVIGYDSNSQKIKKNINNIDAIIIKKSDLDTYYIKNILGYFIKLSNIYIVQKENYIIYSRVRIWLKLKFVFSVRTSLKVLVKHIIVFVK